MCCSICYNDWDSINVLHDMQTKANKHNYCIELEKVISDSIDDYELLKKYSWNTSYKCPTLNCNIEICTSCYGKLNNKYIEDPPFACPFCREIDWKEHFTAILFFIMIKANDRIGVCFIKELAVLTLNEIKINKNK